MGSALRLTLIMKLAVAAVLCLLASCVSASSGKGKTRGDSYAEKLRYFEGGKPKTERTKLPAKSGRTKQSSQRSASKKKPQNVPKKKTTTPKAAKSNQLNNLLMQPRFKDYKKFDDPGLAIVAEVGRQIGDIKIAKRLMSRYRRDPDFVFNILLESVTSPEVQLAQNFREHPKLLTDDLRANKRHLKMLRKIEGLFPEVLSGLSGLTNPNSYLVKLVGRNSEARNELRRQIAINESFLVKLFLRIDAATHHPVKRVRELLSKRYNAPKKNKKNNSASESSGSESLKSGSESSKSGSESSDFSSMSSNSGSGTSGADSGSSAGSANSTNSSSEFS